MDREGKHARISMAHRRGGLGSPMSRSLRRFNARRTFLAALGLAAALAFVGVLMLGGFGVA
jgi:hypothetical protein